MNIFLCHCYMNRDLVRIRVVNLKTLPGTGVLTVTGVRFAHTAKRRLGAIFKTRICASISCFHGLRLQLSVRFLRTVSHPRKGHLCSVEIRYTVKEIFTRAEVGFISRSLEDFDMFTSIFFVSACAGKIR